MLNYFGDCPVCGQNDGHLNIGRTQVMLCATHRVKWTIGVDVFSSWQDETEADWQRNAETLREFREVEPLRATIAHETLAPELGPIPG